MPRPYSDLQGLDLRHDYYDLVKDCCFHLSEHKLLETAPMPPKGDEVELVELLTVLDRAEAEMATSEAC